MLSAAKTPFTPQSPGSRTASGTSSITFLSRAMNREIFACPRAMNVFWQALCSPNIVIPERKYGIIPDTHPTSSVSVVVAYHRDEPLGETGQRSAPDLHGALHHGQCAHIYVPGLPWVLMKVLSPTEIWTNTVPARYIDR